MQITIPLQELQQRKLFLATPMYGGMCAGMFCKSMSDLAVKCAQNGIVLQIYYLFNESLITRARNYCCDEFMRSGATHMMFIDSDIGFDADHVMTLLALASDESEYDVICGPYPKKCIAWEKIKQAVDSGAADANPNSLENFVGDYVFNPVNGGGQHPVNLPMEVMESGTGFMMIKRRVFEKLEKEHPDWYYKPDHARTAAFDGSREIMQYFQAEIDNFKPEKYWRETLEHIRDGTGIMVPPDVKASLALKYADDEQAKRSKRYLSEDYLFCQEVRRSGMKVWLCPWIELKHVGSYVFGGSLTAIASIGASATVDPTKLGEKT